MADVWRYRVDIAGLVGGPGLSTYHFDPTIGAPTEQDCVDAVELFIQSFDVFTSNSVTFTGADEIEVIDLTSGQQTGSLAVTSFSEAGDDSATMLGPINQVLVRWNTSTYANGRRVLGKTFLPGFCEDSNETGGVVQAAVVTAVQTGAQILADSGTGFGVYSRTNHLIAPADTASVWNQWAILSGRRDG
uniref:Uncharacterized protein n=1 Tax=uncultured prokaryote TaxID=198431 RepID=A0A0H5PVL6_9ZZZZ|nr:hypothetical protein [uncultured prokaryote]